MRHSLTPFSHLVTAATPLEPNERPNLTQVPSRLTFVDQSVLHIRENYVTDTGKIDYAYQWQTADHRLIHRWDNAHGVDLPTSPHHQHVGSEQNIQPSEPMTLEKILSHIASRINTSFADRPRLISD